MKKPPQKICRSFRQDFPEFVARAEALDVSIQLSKQKRKYGQDRVFWLDGYLQLTGYLRNSDGSPFTHADAVKNIDKILSENEADWKAVSGMTVAERFARVMDQMRKAEPQYRMIGCVELPCGDKGHCFFMAEYQGGVSLKGIGDVARAKAEWRKDERSPEQLARFCDALEADFAARAIQPTKTEAA
jgi:hypothetical protein